MDADEKLDRLLRMLGKLFRKWGLSEDQQTDLLQMSLHEWNLNEPGSRRRTDVPMERIAYLFRIHRYLRIAFPENPELRYTWVTTENRAFDGRTPLAVMQTERLQGIQSVVRYLEWALEF